MAEVVHGNSQKGAAPRQPATAGRAAAQRKCGNRRGAGKELPAAHFSGEQVQAVTELKCERVLTPSSLPGGTISNDPSVITSRAYGTSRTRKNSAITVPPVPWSPPTFARRSWIVSSLWVNHAIEAGPRLSRRRLRRRSEPYLPDIRWRLVIREAQSRVVGRAMSSTRRFRIAYQRPQLDHSSSAPPMPSPPSGLLICACRTMRKVSIHSSASIGPEAIEEIAHAAA